MKIIGVIASESSDTGARVILNEREGVSVKAEDLVLVENRESSLVMIVLRKRALCPHRRELLRLQSRCHCDKRQGNWDRRL